jgi:hypothetical protein
MKLMAQLWHRRGTKARGLRGGHSRSPSSTMSRFTATALALAQERVETGSVIDAKFRHGQLGDVNADWFEDRFALTVPELIDADQPRLPW